MDQHKFLLMSKLYGFLNPEQKLSVPSSTSDIYIDVGLSGDAPNSALWLLNKSAFCIGIEPVKEHWNALFSMDYLSPNGGFPFQEWPVVQLFNHSIMYKGEKVADISHRFVGVHCAIADQDNLSLRTFYLNSFLHGESGSSSLLHPKERPLQFSNREYIYDKEILVPTCSLDFIINHLDWPISDPITHLKTDVEGSDFDAVKSSGAHLERIIYVSAEWNHNSNESVKRSFYDFMCSKGFSVHKCEGGNIDFVNNRYTEKIKARGLVCRTHGM